MAGGHGGSPECASGARWGQVLIAACYSVLIADEPLSG
ncbi:hypothetical protein LG3211_4435 [Lysobacter gummosus]|nr:hypothetical protein LG3211_4435 [Lysobacter gummosus]